MMMIINDVILLAKSSQSSGFFLWLSRQDPVLSGHFLSCNNFNLLSANSGAELCNCNVCWPTTTWFLISVFVDVHFG